MQAEQIKEALLARAPVVADWYKEIVHTRYQDLVDEFGLSMAGVSHSDSFFIWRETVRPAAIWTREGDETIYLLDETKLERIAHEYSEKAVLAWYDKIIGKVGELEKADCRYVSECRFDIIGVKMDNNIRIEQNMIMNISSRGKLFNQFPCRCYVNGKFTSEAKLKELLKP